MRSAQFSIGQVSELTGIPASTLRSWERRYGYPIAERTAGGHRCYDQATIDRLHLIKAAIDAGLPISEAIRMRAGELYRVAFDVRRPAPSAERIDEIVGAVLEGDAASVWRSLERSWYALGASRFARELFAPLMSALGRGWAQGDLGVGEEHFAANLVGDFLGAQRASLAQRPRPEARLVFAALPRERHALGLSMSATLAAAGGAHVVYLGADTPIASLIHAGAKARAIVTSVAGSADRGAVARDLYALRAALPAAIWIVVGGRGAPPVRGDRIYLCNDFALFERWLAELLLLAPRAAQSPLH